MIPESVKAKLHQYIEQASKSQIMAIYAIMEADSAIKNTTYDEETLNILEGRLDDMVKGRSKTLTLEQTVNNLKEYRKQYGI